MGSGDMEEVMKSVACNWDAISLLLLSDRWAFVIELIGYTVFRLTVKLVSKFFAVSN